MAKPKKTEGQIFYEVFVEYNKIYGALYWDELPSGSKKVFEIAAQGRNGAPIQTEFLRGVRGNLFNVVTMHRLLEPS